MDELEENKIQIPEVKSYDLANLLAVDLAELKKSIKNKKKLTQQNTINK